MISTVIFDLDGLLTDTERLHCQAWRQTLACVGIEVSEEEFADHWIRAGLGIDDFVRRRAGSTTIRTSSGGRNSASS
jgi:beta-phosphoglucomutase-like phosphatase (HAD superfamily)